MHFGQVLKELNVNTTVTLPSAVTSIDSQVGTKVSWRGEDVYPVMKLLPLPARKTVAARYSSGFDSLPKGL